MNSLFIAKRKIGEIFQESTSRAFLKMEGFFLLKEMLLPGNKMCKIDLKYAYFPISLSLKSRTYLRF